MNLKKLSQTLNLSQTTVSRALNGYPEVKEHTRLRVQQFAKEHNYRPSNRARSLATGKAMAIGHVIRLSKHENVNPIFTEFLSGASEEYSKAGYDLILSVVRDEDEEKAYREMLSKHSVDGVILHGPRVPDPRIELLQTIKMPFLMHGRATKVSYDYSWLDMNNKSAFKRATQFLLDLGHQRIALINGPKSFSFAKRRTSGYLLALKENGIKCDQDIIVHDEMMETYGYESVMKMMRLASPPTAFLVSSIIPAIGVRRAIQELGLKMGDDISVIIHDDELSFLRNEGQNKGDVPMFTCTSSSVKNAGKRCAEILLDIIKDPTNSPHHELWEAKLIIGNSTGSAKLK